MADNQTVEQRSKTMAAVKGKNTSLELMLDARLKKIKVRYQRNVERLPGKPDFVFHAKRLVVFVDGDFWHGWRFPQWRDTLPEYWQNKISRNRLRDRKNVRKLRRQGWTVLRFWEHSIKRDIDRVVARILSTLKNSN